MRRTRRGFPRGRGIYSERNVYGDRNKDDNTRYFEELMKKSAAKRGGFTYRENVGMILYTLFCLNFIQVG